MKNAYKISVGSFKGRDYLEDLGIEGRIILKWILEKQNRNLWTGFICLRIGTSDMFL
jgi:hypothetical protein